MIIHRNIILKPFDGFDNTMFTNGLNYYFILSKGAFICNMPTNQSTILPITVVSHLYSYICRS